MAHTKAGGSTKNGRDSISKRLGVKIQDGETVFPGQIILRQRGTRYMAGDNVRIGKDDTLYAAKEGKVKFYEKVKTNFDGNKRRATFVEVQ